jgi:hypothetical protein
VPFRGARRVADAPDQAVQQLVLERYLLLERLGAGGFGVVWRARDELLGRDVAVKRILLGPDGDGERATREAQASARLAHPAIVALYEACPHGEAFYLISELVEGETLAGLIAQEALTDEQILQIGIALLEALEHAHERGVIHRDIKPQNVLVPDHSSAAKHRVAAKLTDFGGASLVGEDALTRTGDVLGTLAYMAPEQSEGREAGEQADLYSLALVLYESFSGINPVRGANAAATARRIGTRLEPLERRRRDLPRPLTRCIDAALAPSSRARGTLEDLRLDLEQALDEGLPTRRGARAPRRAVPVPPMPHEPAPTATQTATPRLIGRPRDRERPLQAPDPVPGLPRTLWIALAILLIAWQVAVGRAGVGLLAAAALLPLAAMPPERGSRRLSPRWLAAGLAPALGMAGLAGAFPALAGQAVRWRQRVVLGALGYWWLMLAEPLLARRLWFGAVSGASARAAWEGSIQTTAVHVIGPLLTLAVLGGALLWGLAALLLPLIVRGRSAVLDVLAAAVWSLALVLATTRVQEVWGAAGSHSSPRGVVLGAVVGGMFVVGARALRGPV